MREGGKVGRSEEEEGSVEDDADTAAEENAGGRREEARKDWTRARAMEALVFWWAPARPARGKGELGSHRIQEPRAYRA
jgi:hypothetical protein